MIKKPITMLTLAAFLTAFSSFTLLAKDPDLTSRNDNLPVVSKPAPSIKQLISDKTQEINASSSEFQVNKYSKKAWDDTEQQKPKKGWTKKHTLWTVVIAASAVGLFFLIKYAKKCLKYESNCYPDEICQCLVYEEEK